MTYSYVCDGTPLSNLRSLSQTRSHYDRGGNEKSDRATDESDRDPARDPARDHSSHPFCGRQHPCLLSEYLPCFVLSLRSSRSLSSRSFAFHSVRSFSSRSLSFLSFSSSFLSLSFRARSSRLTRPPLALHGWYLLQLFSRLQQAFRS